MFIIIMASVYLLGNAYVFFRGWQALSPVLPFAVTIIISILYWLGALSFFASFLFRGVAFVPKIGHYIHQIGTGWLVFTLYMVILLLIFDILRLFHVGYPYGFYTALVITIVALIYGNYKYHHPDIRVVDLTIDKPVDSPNKRLKVVGISDIHLGLGTDKDQLQKYVRMINEQKPDIVIICGDLIDNSVKPVIIQRMEEEINSIQAPMGVYMVSGNHEYISGIKESMEFIGKTKIQYLRDTVVTLTNGIQIVGRDDRANRNRKPLPELMQGVDLAKPVIMLDHQPFDLHQAAEAGVDLQFSGHTHGGQVWPMSIYINSLYELPHGYMKKGNTNIYVSSGLSLWGPPFRIGSVSELVVFELTFK